MKNLLFLPQISSQQRLRKCLESECENCFEAVTRVACSYNPKNPETFAEKVMIFRKNGICQYHRYFIENATSISDSATTQKISSGEYA
jgi:hypothetical protein